MRGRWFCSGVKFRLDLCLGLCLELRVVPGCHLFPPIEEEEPCYNTHKREGFFKSGGVKNRAFW